MPQVTKGNASVPQIRVQWSHLPPDHSTWEDYHVLRHRFPAAAIWEGDFSSEGGNVRTQPLAASDMEALAQDAMGEPGPSSTQGTQQQSQEDTAGGEN